MAVALFPFMDALFNKEKFKSMMDVDKKSNFFMVQRFMSIIDPVHANLYNKVGMNPVAVMNYWHKLMCLKYNSKPNWTFTKKEEPTKRYSDSFIKKMDKIEKPTILAYINKRKISRKDFDFSLEMHPDKVFNDLMKLQEHLEEVN